MTQHSRRIQRDRYVRMIFRQLPGALWTTDCALCLTYVAGRLATKVGPTAKRGMSVFDVLETRDPTHPIIAYHRAALAGESQSFEYEFHGRWYALFLEQLTDRGNVAGCIGAAFDITEHRAIRENLARSQALLAQAQRLAHVGSFEWDVKSNVVRWSDELLRIHGLEPDQFHGTYEAFLERVHPGDLEATRNTVLDAVRKATPFAYEHRIVRPDGTVRLLHSRGDVLKDHDDRQVIAGCCWDVTELNEAIDGLRRARSLLAATVESTADGLLVVDMTGRVTIYNRRFRSLWRIPADLARENDDEKLLAYVCDQLEDSEHFMSSTRELYSHPDRESFDILHFKDGRVFERYSKPQRIGDSIVGRVWSFRDVTEREKLFRRAVFLADATRLLSSLDIEPALDSVAHLAVPYLGDGCAIDLLGHGQPRRLLVVSREGSESFSPELHSAVMAGHSTIYWMGTRSCMAVPLVVRGDVVGAMTFIGPHKRRYTEQDLEFVETLARRAALAVENARLYRGVQEAVHARDEFLAIAAHEIRGPITSVHMAVQGLQKGKVPAVAASKILGIIEREDRRLARFVDELLDLGRIQTGQIYFNFEEVDLAEVVREAITSMGSELARSESALSVVASGRPVGQWDRFRLSQVVTNLLANAIKFGQGKPIDIHVKEHHGVTTLEVQDRGIGIPPEMVEQIFKPFERAVSARNYGGLGLGLFIVNTIVGAFGGTIRVESQLDIGSTFTIELRNARNS